jgi:hypothetical protein
MIDVPVAGFDQIVDGDEFEGEIIMNFMGICILYRYRRHGSAEV